MKQDIFRSLESLPVLAVCGGREEQRSTVLDKVRGGLLEKGFRVVVTTLRKSASTQELKRLQLLCRQYDAVLVNSGPTVPFGHLLIESPEQDAPEINSFLVTTINNPSSDISFVAQVVSWFEKKWLSGPVWGCVLVGGKSKRMGRAKHLILRDGQTWVERTVAILQQHVDRVVISGEGELPGSLAHLERIKDEPMLAGPLAGILSALRRKPEVSLLVAACDQPDMQPQALQWLLSHRKPGVKAVMPTLSGQGKVEPLLAYYDFRCQGELEEIVAQGSMQINRLKDGAGVSIPLVPPELKECWRNVNTVQELQEATGRS